MTLLTAGYWQTTYWAENYWNTLYWPAYSAAAAPTPAPELGYRVPRRRLRIIEPEEKPDIFM